MFSFLIWIVILKWLQKTTSITFFLNCGEFLQVKIACSFNKICDRRQKTVECNETCGHFVIKIQKKNQKCVNEVTYIHPK